MVRSGHTTITNGDFEGLDLAIEVQGGTVSIAESNFRQNRDSIYVTNGSISIANTNFSASQGTALHVVGGNVVLKNKTLVEARPNQPALNISNRDLVQYELPAPLGRYVFIQDNSRIYYFEPGEHRGSFPFACSAGVVGNLSDAQYQSNPGCASVCAAGYYCGPGTVLPTLCPVGSYCATGSSAPTACKPGTVGRNESLKRESECAPCPPGSWCSAGDEIMCPQDTYQPEPSKGSAEARRALNFQRASKVAPIGGIANATRTTTMTSTTQEISNVFPALLGPCAWDRATRWLGCPCCLDTGAQTTTAPI